jgi:hypothetical protein
MPFGTGLVGAGGCTTRSQSRQDFFSRAVSTTFSFAAMKSRISETSSPISRSAPPQSGQSSPGSRTMRSRGALSAIRGLPRRRGAARSGAGRLAGSFGSAAVSAEAIATSRSSSAS